jgi:hypothetical protein
MVATDLHVIPCFLNLSATDCESSPSNWDVSSGERVFCFRVAIRLSWVGCSLSLTGSSSSPLEAPYR